MPEENKNLDNWNKMCEPPKWALSEIKGGRLSGFTDISPIWRIKVITETYGECGRGWRYTIDKVWSEALSDGQIGCFVLVSIYTRNEELEWSPPIMGLGGAMLVSKEKSGLYSNDDAHKMALTDALGNAMKALGVGANIYAGSKYAGSKYTEQPKAPKSDEATLEELTDAMKNRLKEMGMKTIGEVRTFIKGKTIHDIKNELGV